MVKYQERNGAFRRFRKFKIIFEKTVPNGAVSIIDVSRESFTQKTERQSHF
jgi:hypothetical protein